MALSNRQLQVLNRMAESPYGRMTKFEVVEDIGHLSLRKLLKDGFVIATPEKGGQINIAQTGVDAVSGYRRRETPVKVREAKILMPPKSRKPRRSYAADREMVEMAKTMDLDAIVKKTGRTPESILKSAMRLGVSIKGRKATAK